jgi:hypothetical protein
MNPVKETMNRNKKGNQLPIHHPMTKNTKTANKLPRLSNLVPSKLVQVVFVLGLMAIIAILSDFDGLIKASGTASASAGTASFELIIKGGQVKQ